MSFVSVNALWYVSDSRMQTNHFSPFFLTYPSVSLIWNNASHPSQIPFIPVSLPHKMSFVICWAQDDMFFCLFSLFQHPGWSDLFAVNYRGTYVVTLGTHVAWLILVCVLKTSAHNGCSGAWGGGKVFPYEWCQRSLTSPDERTLFMYSRKDSSLISLSVKIKLMPLPCCPAVLYKPFRSSIRLAVL